MTPTLTDSGAPVAAPRIVPGMDIGVVGSGNIGGTAARGFAQAGHNVVIGSRRGAAGVAELVEQIGGNVRGGTIEEAASHGTVVLVAIPQHAVADLPAPAFAGKVVADANNYYPGRDGHDERLDRDETTSTELLAERLPGARVVKAFNTMQSRTLGDGGRPDAPAAERLALYVASDDAEAKATVAGLIEELGFAAVDAGGLADGGRRLQPGSAVYAVELTGAEAARRLAG